MAKKQADLTTFAATFITLAWSIIEQGVANVNRSREAAQTLARLIAELKGDALKSALVSLFGNGSQSKVPGERITGSVVDATMDHMVTDAKAKAVADAKANGKKKPTVAELDTLAKTVSVPVTVRAFVSKCRKIGDNASMAGLDKVLPRGMDAAYAFVSGKQDVNGKKIAAAPAETAKPPKVTATESAVTEFLSTDEGIATALRIMESQFLARKDVIRVAIVHDAAMKIAIGK